MPRELRHHWIFEYLRERSTPEKQFRVTASDQEFVDAYVTATKAGISARYSVGKRCPQLEIDLRGLATTSSLMRRKRPLMTNEAKDGPGWVYEYWLGKHLR